MPLSRPDTLSRVLNFVWEQNPSSILDVGVGFGAMGVLFRQVTDIRWGRMKNWQTVIHGIEIHADYHNPIWQYAYNAVRIGSALKEVPQMPQSYDIVFLGDILEHFDKESAHQLLDECLKKANRFVMVTTPATFSSNEQEAARFGNPYEEHQCLLEDKDFPEGSVIEQYGNQKLIIIPKK